jgi:hypothetical protein
MRKKNEKEKRGIWGGEYEMKKEEGRGETVCMKLITCNLFHTTGFLCV